MDAQTIIARRVAQELRPGNLVNLGIGIPTQVANFVPPGIHVFFQSENGLIGTGPVPEEGKRRIDVDGKPYLLELPLRADFALVGAFLADYLGNLTYALTARNFNPVIAMAGATVIVDAEHVVPVGMISPDHVMTPAPLVDYLIARP